MTALEGLVMGTRSGDIDPAIIFHLRRSGGYSVDELDDLLNRRSGLLGMTGRGDMRDVQAAADAGDGAAELALEVYAHRARHYLGAYYAVLGRLDVIAFTAGIGEHNARMRRRILTGLEGLGIRLDDNRNTGPDGKTRVISADGSAVTVLVVPTDEELEIARQTLAVTDIA